jgi:hypothetical protein
MSDLVNLRAESGRDIISDDVSPTLALTNTASGLALKLNSGAGEPMNLVGGQVTFSNTSDTKMYRFKTTGDGLDFEYTSYLNINWRSSPSSNASIVNLLVMGNQYRYITHAVKDEWKNSITNYDTVATVLDNDAEGFKAYSNSTISGFISYGSSASAALFHFNGGGAVSTASIANASANLAFAIRVKHDGLGVHGWIPVYSAIS